MLGIPSLRRIRESIFHRQDDLRIRIGAMHVSQNRNIEQVVENLWDLEVRVFSQWGEDGILDFLFQKVGISKPKILELGAGCFAECNSRFAAHLRNASVYAVDAREDLSEGIHKSGLMWRNNLNYEVIEINTENILDIVERAERAMDGINAVSIDLDGNDYWVLEKIPLDKVFIVVVEYNPIFGGNVNISVPNEKKARFERHHSGLYFGASLPAFIKLLNEKNFTFIGTNRVGNNAFFVCEKMADQCNVKLPQPDLLDKFLDWRCRESRNEHGVLTYDNIRVNLQVVGEFDVINLTTGVKQKLKELSI